MSDIRPEYETLDALPRNVARPGYDPAKLTPGIVHVGVGNFHRAHMGVYLDRLHALGDHSDWGIVGAGVRPGDAAMRDRLSAQDWMCTVVELDPAGLTARLTAPMCGFAEVTPEATVAAMADPRVRIVSLTVTEGGYFTDAEGYFDPAHPDILADTGDGAPRTVFGMMLAALAARRTAGLPGFTVMSCDNLPGNGHAAHAACAGLAELRGEATLLDDVAFPNGMVDCITPATDDGVRAMVREKFGIADAAPVICEPFRQWVMEDNFPHGRPPLEEVGVEFVTDVVPYELMKLRVLNAGHASLAYAAALLGHRMVHEAMGDKDIVDWLRTVLSREAIPTLNRIDGVDFEDYLETCLVRFANPGIGDTVARLCLDGSNRQPKFILPTVRDRLTAGAPVGGLALEVALWMTYCAEAGGLGAPVLDDERAAELTAAARAGVDAFLDIDDVFGDLARPDFAGPVQQARSRIEKAGVRGALQDYAAGRMAG